MSESAVFNLDLHAASVIVLAPASYLLVEVWGLGVAGAFWALVAAEAVKAALLSARWAGSRWVTRARVVDEADAGDLVAAE